MAEQFSSSSALKYHFNVNGIVEQVFFNKAQWIILAISYAFPAKKGHISS